MSGNVILLVDSELTIQCMVESRSSNLIQYEWHKQDKMLAITSSVLYIPKLTMLDNGVYTCTARLGKLLKRTEANLNLIVRGMLLLWFLLHFWQTLSDHVEVLIKSNSLPSVMLVLNAEVN